MEFFYTFICIIKKKTLVYFYLRFRNNNRYNWYTSVNNFKTISTGIKMFGTGNAYKTDDAALLLKREFFVNSII
jgi:hypothetical protein